MDVVPHCVANNNNFQLSFNFQKIAYAMFKVLGGSSTQNIMMAVRGNHKHYDDWAAQGAKGWSYKKVLPYFKKLEDFKVAKYLNR